MTYEDIEFNTDGPLGIITLNRPDVYNALSKPMVHSIIAALDVCDKNGAVGAVILKGAGKSFCAGGDVKQMHTDLDSVNITDEMLIDHIGGLIRKIRGISKPVIAMVHNVAAGGGCNLALLCDFVFAAEGTRFIQSFAGIGLMPDVGGIYLLSKYMPLARLTDWVMTASPLTAEEALNMGMIKTVCAPEKLEQETFAFAEMLAAKPRNAIAKIKSVINHFMFNRIDEEILLETQFQKMLVSTNDYREGVVAFVEKRKPEFNK